MIGSINSERPTTWRDRGACLGADPNLFSAESRTGAGLRRTAEAKAICAACPVTAECLDDALDTWDDFGTRGGYTGPERRHIRMLRRRTSTRPFIPRRSPVPRNPVPPGVVVPHGTKEERDAAILELFRRGHDPGSIAEHLGCSRGHVNRTLRPHHGPTGHDLRAVAS